MNLLLDTHVVLWALLEPDRINPAVRAAVADPANDRLLVAQARRDRILVTHDRAFEAYGVPVFWT